MVSLKLKNKLKHTFYNLFKAKLLETALTGFVEEKYRLNPKAEALKTEVSFLA